MPRIKVWRVRVYRKIEDWVDVQADTALQAESEAYKLPGVLSVFGKSALPGDAPANVAAPEGVQQE